MQRKYIIFVLVLLALIVAIILLSQRIPSNTSSNQAPPEPSGTPTIVQFVTPTIAAYRNLKMYLVKLNDNGKSGAKIGCNDSLVFVTRQIPSSNRSLLKTTLEQLLATENNSASASGYYNAFSSSNLTVDKIVIADNTASIYLKGTLSLGGVCDNPRVEEQIKATAKQFQNIEEVELFINGKPSSQVLSGKGE